MNTEDRLKKISSLQELKKEKEKLRLSMQANQERIGHSLDIAKTTLPKFMAKKIVLPAGAVGLTIFGISQLVKGNKNHKVKEEELETSVGALAGYGAVALRLLKSGINYFKKNATSERSSKSKSSWNILGKRKNSILS